MESGPGSVMDNTSRLLASMALAWAELAVFQKAGWSKEIGKEQVTLAGTVILRGGGRRRR